MDVSYKTTERNNTRTQNGMTKITGIPKLTKIII